MDNGFKQGKLIGETLKYLLDKVLDEVLPNDREVLLREATSYKKKQQGCVAIHGTCLKLYKCRMNGRFDGR